MRIIHSVFIIVAVASASAHWWYPEPCGCPDPHVHVKQEAASGWEDQWAVKSHSCLDGTIGTRGPGGARVRANNMGVQTQAKAKCGAYSRNKFNKNLDSWGNQNAWYRDSYGNKNAWSDKWQNNVDSKARVKAAGAGCTKLDTRATQDETEANVKASRGSYTNTRLKRRADNWQAQEGWEEDCKGNANQWNSDWAEKKKSNNGARGVTRGRGSNSVNTDQDGSDVKVRGTCGAKGAADHRVKWKGWGSDREWDRKDGQTSSWNKNWGANEKSNGFVKSKGYGKTKINASSDAQDGASLDAFATKGTCSKYDNHKDEDNWGDNNQWQRKKWVDTVRVKPTCGCDGHHHHGHHHHHHHDDYVYEGEPVYGEDPVREEPAQEEQVQEEQVQEEQAQDDNQEDDWNGAEQKGNWGWGCGCPCGHHHHGYDDHYHGPYVGEGKW